MKDYTHLQPADLLRSYEPPIKVIEGPMQTITRAVEEKVVAEARKALCVDVDKDELLKCLQYDRDQFVHGFEMGSRKIWPKSFWMRDDDTDAWICQNCGHEICGYDEYPKEHGIKHCENCGCYMLTAADYCMEEEYE